METIRPRSLALQQPDSRLYTSGPLTYFCKARSYGSTRVEQSRLQSATVTLLTIARREISLCDRDMFNRLSRSWFEVTVKSYRYYVGDAETVARVCSKRENVGPAMDREQQHRRGTACRLKTSASLVIIGNVLF